LIAGGVTSLGLWRRCLIEPVLEAVVLGRYDQVEAVGGELLGQLETDATGGSGDDGKTATRSDVHGMRSTRAREGPSPEDGAALAGVRGRR
jgi:hypothetical protein